MDIWEIAVETYLTTSRGVYLNPQYVLGEPNGWRAEPDFLALDFYERMAWMVEVSIAPSRIWEKAAQFEQEYKPRLRRQLVQTKVLAEVNSDWKIGFWAFVFADQKVKTLEAMKIGVVQCYKVTSLEETLRDFWVDRFDTKATGLVNEVV